MHVGAVEPGGTHPDEHFARARFGVGMVFDDDLLVADGDCPHGAAVYAARSSKATHSMWGVCANMSTGRTRLSV